MEGDKQEKVLFVKGTGRREEWATEWEEPQWKTHIQNISQEEAYGGGNVDIPAGKQANGQETAQLAALAPKPDEVQIPKP